MGWPLRQVSSPARGRGTLSKTLPWFSHVHAACVAGGTVPQATALREFSERSRSDAPISFEDSQRQDYQLSLQRISPKTPIRRRRDLALQQHLKSRTFPKHHPCKLGTAPGKQPWHN